MHNIKEAWHKLNLAPNDAILIVADTDEGPEFCHMVNQNITENLIVYADNNLSRRQKATYCRAEVKTGTLAQLAEFKATFTEGYGFTKAIIVSDNLASCILPVIDTLAKGSTLVICSQDPEPPMLDFSTGRLHYDQLTIISV